MSKEGAAKFIKDLLFPIYCVDCGREGEWWCGECFEKNKIKAFDFGQAVACLDGATAFFVYDENSPAAKLIKLFKYQYAREIAGLWKKIFAEADFSAATRAEWGASPVIIPVPLHARRERERGFNQAEILSQIFSSATKYRMMSGGLVRIKYTGQQAKLSAEDRNRNLTGAFQWQAGVLAPENIILVDDVYTTGATMRECAKILKHAGARRVWGLVLAMGG